MTGLRANGSGSSPAVSPAHVSDGHPWQRRLVGILPQLLLPAIIALVALAVRLTYLEPIENDGDAIGKWWIAKQMLHGTTPHWNHHAARLAINVPTYLVQLCLGTAPEMYYVLPVSVGIAQALVAYAVGTRVSGVYGGVLAALLVTAFPEVERSGSQLLPGGFCATFVGLAVYGVLRHQGNHHRGWLLFASVNVFLAYMSRITAVYCLPGLVIVTWLTRRRLIDVVWLLAPAAGLFLLETAVYNLVSDFRLGQLSVIASSHGTKRRPEITVDSTAARYVRADWYWKFPLLMLAATVPGTLALFRPRRIGIVIAALLSYLLFLTFPTRGFSTVRALGFHQRYFDDCLVLLMVIHATFIAGVMNQWLARATRLRRVLLRRASWFAVIAAVGYGAASLSAGWRRLGPKHPLSQLRADSRLLVDAYRRGIPIVAPARHEKALNILRYVMLPDDLLLNDKGEFDAPPVRWVNAQDGRYAYLANGVGKKEVREAFARDRCYVRVERVANPHHARRTKITYADTKPECDRK